MEELRTILSSVGPSNDTLAWDLALYALFFFNLLTLLMLPDGSTTGTILSIFVLISIFIDKTFAFGYLIDSGPYTPQTCHAKIFVGTYLIRALMFAAPLTVAASTDNGKVRTLGIIAGIGGGVYMFTRWFFDQRDIEAPDITCFNTANAEVMAQNLGMALVLARLMLRHRLRLGVVHRHIPVAVAGDLAAHDVEVELS
ncbi:MAG: hypothetical protein ACUVSU_11600 [Aggregatilineaceae bacterium]